MEIVLSKEALKAFRDCAVDNYILLTWCFLLPVALASLAPTHSFHHTPPLPYRAASAASPISQTDLESS